MESNQRQKHNYIHNGQLIFDKEPKIYTGKKRASSTHDADQHGWLHVEELK